MQKEFKYLVCDEEPEIWACWKKKGNQACDRNKTLNMLEGNENQACDRKPKFKHVGGKWNSSIG